MGYAQQLDKHLKKHHPNFLGKSEQSSKSFGDLITTQAEYSSGRVAPRSRNQLLNKMRRMPLEATRSGIRKAWIDDEPSDKLTAR